MIRKITMWAFTALFVLALAAPAVFAVSPAEQACMDAGGTYTGTGNPKECVYDTNPGNPQSTNANEPFTTTNTSTGAGGGGGEQRGSSTQNPGGHTF